MEKQKTKRIRISVQEQFNNRMRLVQYNPYDVNHTWEEKARSRQKAHLSKLSISEDHKVNDDDQISSRHFGENKLFTWHNILRVAEDMIVNQKSGKSRSAEKGSGIPTYETGGPVLFDNESQKTVPSVFDVSKVVGKSYDRRLAKSVRKCSVLKDAEVNFDKVSL